MDPKDSSAQFGSSSQEPVAACDQGQNQSEENKSPFPPPEHSSKQPTQPSQESKTVEIVYKIVHADRPEYSPNGNVYFRYSLPPLRDSTGCFCIAAFYWHDVEAGLECLYYPRIRFFDNLKPIQGSLKGGERGVQSVQISVCIFIYRGGICEDMMFDDNGNQMVIAVMMMDDGSAVTLYAKMVRDGEDENGVSLSNNERERLGLHS